MRRQVLAIVMFLSVAGACGEPIATPEAGGDPIGTPGPGGEPLYEVSGTVSLALTAQPFIEGESEVGIIWVRRVQLPTGELQLRLEAGPFSPLLAELPAPFSLAALTPPSTAAHGEYVFGDRLAGSTVGESVATGLLVVARAGTMASIPSELDERYGIDGLPEGEAFAQFVASIEYLSPAVAVHVMGAATNGWEATPEGFFLEDFGDFIDQSSWNTCLWAEQYKVMETPEFATCLAPGGLAETQCQADCAARDDFSREQESDAVCAVGCTQSVCQVELALPVVVAACGEDPSEYGLDVKPIDSTGLPLEIGRRDARADVFARGSIIPVAYPGR